VYNSFNYEQRIDASMTSIIKRNNFDRTFKMLTRFERQLIALRIICCQMSEELFIAKVVASGVLDTQGEVFSEQSYKTLFLLLGKFGLLQKKGTRSILPELHHELLVLMPEDEMGWVHAMVQYMYKDSLPYYDNGNAKERACLISAIYNNELEEFMLYQNDVSHGNRIIFFLINIFGSSSVDVVWLESREPVIRDYICITLLSDYYCNKVSVINKQAIFEVFVSHMHENTNHAYLLYCSAMIYLARGDIKTAQMYCDRIQNDKSAYALALQATFSFLDMDFVLAHKLYRKALAGLRKHAELPSYYFDNILGVFHAFCVAYTEKNVKQLITNAVNYDKFGSSYWAMPMGKFYWLFHVIELIERGDPEAAKQELNSMAKCAKGFVHPLLFAIYQLISCMTNTAHLNQHQDTIYQKLQGSLQAHHGLAVHILYELLLKTDKYQHEAHAYFNTSSIKLRLLNFVQVKEAWEYTFQALEGLLVGDDKKSGDVAKRKRLMWLIDPDKQQMIVVEQSMNKAKKWSHGRAVNLSKLKNYLNDPQFEYLTEQDKHVIAGIHEVSDGWYRSYAFSHQHCFLALVGHPHIAHAQNREVSIELVRGEPELYIEENAQGYHFSLSHFLLDEGVIIEPESLNKYRVIDYASAFAKIGRVITKDGLTIPSNAKDKILDVIQYAKRDIKIHVGIKDIDIPELDGDSTPCVQLLPMKEGVRVTLWVKPLAHHGSYFKIAQGKECFMAFVSENGTEQRIRVQRHFSDEKKHQKALLSRCPSLSQHEYEVGEYEIASPEDVLEVLSELQHYAATEPLTIEWPEGQTFKIKQHVNAKNLSLKISSNTSWFEYDGKITLDDGEVLYMQELFQSLETNNYGRFIRLKNGEFIELTSKLKKQLTVLHALSDDQKINPLGAQVLSDIAAQAENTTFDAGWAAHLEKVKTMRHYAPNVPSTLQATLRDYQTEGYQHLSRLTHWGMGACLADDMGLGKTVQTIALLLERAKQGAALVVAPTSVCFNWMEELNTFSPTLNVYDLRQDDRANLIQHAGKFDVIICSYGLLQHNGDLLIDKSWETIVLDEAQAIKNAGTQRWKTVMKLKGKGRIALSGTPIENHLGELWSIFSFINPGLLGSIKQYQNKYSIPIETKQSPDRIHALRTLVQPYILRRIKSDVLKELPPKTEQTIHVEGTEQEAIFYEALRRTTEERMKDLMAENDRIKVLAEITKLRQACCDSSLVDSSLKIENSKLNAFIKTLKNIIDNGHKALVFSQFVSFLSIIKARIEAENMSYQYLDGATSAAKRKKAVEAFQGGDGDVFLLSLKAGGSGLNLTAADYVIHMDPWWNPAVEDQASDRAHRIGQERPVTIYRFVMQNTIEEKILALHQHKRNLANELLSGQEVSGKLSNDDLMKLISAPAV